jgi:hypothetical protein
LRRDRHYRDRHYRVDNDKVLTLDDDERQGDKVRHGRLTLRASGEDTNVGDEL